MNLFQSTTIQQQQHDREILLSPLHAKKEYEMIHTKGFSSRLKKNDSPFFFYKPMEKALQYLKSDPSVQVTSKGKEIYFTPQINKKEKGIIIYPGCTVDKRSYAPLARRLAHRGYKVILSPNDLDSVFKNKARELMNQNQEVKSWVMLGHSFGGIMASEVAHHNPDKVSGVVLLSSFPIKRFQNKDIHFLDIRATHDKILNNKYANISYQFLVPSKNHKNITIEGGNHANFAYYNNQKGDGIATIDRETQQKIIFSNILKFLEKK
jgi:dienelactone hydrolase